MIRIERNTNMHENTQRTYKMKEGSVCYNHTRIDKLIEMKCIDYFDFSFSFNFDGFLYNGHIQAYIDYNKTSVFLSYNFTHGGFEKGYVSYYSENQLSFLGNTYDLMKKIRNKKSLIRSSIKRTKQSACKRNVYKTSKEAIDNRLKSLDLAMVGVDNFLNRVYDDEKIRHITFMTNGV